MKESRSTKLPTECFNDIFNQNLDNGCKKFLRRSQFSTQCNTAVTRLAVDKSPILQVVFETFNKLSYSGKKFRRCEYIPIENCIIEKSIVYIFK